MAVTIFQHAHFKGTRATYGLGQYVTIPIGNDQISSIKIEPGFFAYFYLHTGFRGQRLVLFPGEYPFVEAWNDHISSMEIFEHDEKLYPLVSFFQHINFGGFKQNLAGLGEVASYNSPFMRNDSITSMKVPDGVKVILFEHVNLGGKSREFGPGDYPNLAHFGFHDNASSVQILRPDLELVNIEYVNEVVLPDGQPIGLSDSTLNDSNLETVSTLTLESEISKSTSRSFSQSTLVGITVTTSTSVGVERGPLSAEVANSVSTTFENSFTIGEEETTSITSKFTKSVTIKIPPMTIGEVTQLLTPKRVRLDAIYTFRLKGTENTFKQDVSILFEEFQEGEAIVTESPIEIFEGADV